MLTLFLFDILQALGGVLGVRWAQNGICTTGLHCVTPGIIQQTGELGVALSTLLLLGTLIFANLVRLGTLSWISRARLRLLVYAMRLLTGYRLVTPLRIP
ncbi:hypothetical protein BGW80DRAFT_1447964 [Lactifluus volemus]|nr:hypothetical protein BGW80DRAFT_1447964 [Lactifluus volemus]